MQQIRYLIIALGFLASLFVSPASSSIVYSGRLDIVGPDFSIDLNNDGSLDFVTGCRMWAGGNGYSTNGFDVELVFDIRGLGRPQDLDRKEPEDHDSRDRYQKRN